MMRLSFGAVESPNSPAVGGLSPAAESGGGSLSSPSETVVCVSAATLEAIEYNSAQLGRSLAILAQTLDTDDSTEDEQIRRDES